MANADHRAKVIFITGASRGFGQAAALKCAERGHVVIGTMRNPRRDGAGLTDVYPGIEVHELDVTDNAQVQRVMQTVADRHGRIDVLLNNAGYGLFGPVEDVSDEEVFRIFNTNTFGQIRTVRAVVPIMRRNGGGKIINLSSGAGRAGGPLTSLYAGSKHAVDAISEALRLEVARWNIQVTILEPGMYKSDWQEGNLDVCERLRTGQSALQVPAERALAMFRERAATRPGSDAVAVAVADIVDLVQPLPLHWPIGDDILRTLEAKLNSTDEQWETWLRTTGGHRTALFQAE